MCRWLCQYTFLIWISNFYKWYAYLFTTSRPEGSFLLLFCKINELVFVTKVEIFPADSQIYGSSSQTWMFSFTNSTQSYQITKNIARPFSDVSFTTENIPRSLKMSLKYYATDCRHVPSFLWHVQYQMESRQKKFWLWTKNISETSGAVVKRKILQSSHFASFKSHQFGFTFMSR